VRPFLLALGVLPLAGLTVGCALSPADVGLEPRCPASGQVSDTIVLIAQAVPTAQLLPCIDPDALPNEWNVPDIDIRDGEATIDLSAGEMDKVALRVTLRTDCEIDGASPVPTDREGARRYDIPTADPAELRGTRLYLFDGGCATYVYDLPSSPRQVTVDEALLTVSLLPRHVVQDSVRVDHDDRLELDPAPTSRS
jgi:hypothetical protein